MLEATKEIVISMIENKYISRYDNDDMNIKEVNKAIKEIYQQLDELSKSNAKETANVIQVI